MGEHNNSTVKEGDFYTFRRKFITGESVRQIHLLQESFIAGFIHYGIN
jgi:hypothetical protein